MLNTNQQNTNAQPPPPHSTQAASATTNVQTLKRRATKTSVALDKVVTNQNILFKIHTYICHLI